MNSADFGDSLRITDHEAEAWTCAALTRNPAGYSEIAKFLTADDFTDGLCRDWFKAFEVLQKRGEPLNDPCLLVKAAREIGGEDYAVLDFAKAAEYPTAGYERHYATKVLEASVARAAQAAAGQILCSASGVEAIQTGKVKLAEAEQRLAALNSHQAEVTESTLRRIALSRLEATDDRGDVPAATKGLERVIGGPFRHGSLIIVGAQPGTGKTLFLIQSMMAAAQAGHGCCLISQEMTADQVGDRIISHSTAVHPSCDDWQELARDAVNKFFEDKQPIKFRRCNQSVTDVVATIRTEREEYGATVFGVDYLQLLKGEGRSRYEQITDVSVQLKNAAVQNEVVIFLAAQLSREVGKRSPAIPRPSDLRDSGQIEQDADVILLLYWPFQDDTLKREEKERQGKNTFHIIVAKNRFAMKPAEPYVCRIEPDRQRLVDLSF